MTTDQTPETLTGTINHDTTVTVAPYRKGEPPIVVNLSEWARKEARLDEVATVTKLKGPELLATFNRACLDLDKLVNALELAHQQAVRAAEAKRAEIILDKVPGILRDKGLTSGKNPTGSEDLRNAVLARDGEYQAALTAADEVKALKALIKGKYDAFERAFRSVRTMVGDQNFNAMLPNRNLSGGTGTAEVGIAGKSQDGFGKPRYT